MIEGPLDRQVRNTASPPARFLLLATLAGVGLGAIARLWMRWISTDPEFSWPGTIGIVASFTVFAAAQAVAAVVRRQARQPRTLALTRAVPTGRAASLVVPRPFPPVVANTFSARVAGEGGVTVLDAIECWWYQHGMRHMGEIWLARGLVGLGGMTS